MIIAKVIDLTDMHGDGSAMSLAIGPRSHTLGDFVQGAEYM